MTLMLLDSASLWYRAYYGMPDTLLSPSGMPVNAIRGYLDMTARLITMYSPNRIVACIEGDWRPTWRVELFPEYKANRLEEGSEVEEEPETLTPQIPVLLDLIDAFGIPMVGVDDYEADDVMATFAEKEVTSIAMTPPIVGFILKPPFGKGGLFFYRILANAAIATIDEPFLSVLGLKPRSKNWLRVSKVLLDFLSYMLGHESPSQKIARKRIDALQ